TRDDECERQGYDEQGPDQPAEDDSAHIGMVAGARRERKEERRFGGLSAWRGRGRASRWGVTQWQARFALGRDAQIRRAARVGSENRCQVMFMMMVFFSVKWSSMASSEASRPSPEAFEPP